MERIKVRSKVDNTTHLKYGALKKGQELEIDKADFGDEIFELADREKAGKTAGKRRDK
jgi:hypothetical protein